MDIYTYLKKDHKHVSELMEALLATQDMEERADLFATIQAELTLHAKTEEATFYAALENRKQTEERIEGAEEAHDEMEKYLKKLGSLPIDSEEWIEQFGEFKHCVTHHVEEEEGKIFEKAKKILSDKQAKELAEEMDALKHDPKVLKKAGIAENALL